jgi:hypothetical protein
MYVASSEASSNAESSDTSVVHQDVKPAALFQDLRGN